MNNDCVTVSFIVRDFAENRVLHRICEPVTILREQLTPEYMESLSAERLIKLCPFDDIYSASYSVYKNHIDPDDDDNDNMDFNGEQVYLSQPEDFVGTSEFTCYISISHPAKEVLLPNKCIVNVEYYPRFRSTILLGRLEFDATKDNDLLQSFLEFTDKYAKQLYLSERPGVSPDEELTPVYYTALVYRRGGVHEHLPSRPSEFQNNTYVYYRITFDQ